MDFKWQSQYGDVVRIRAPLGEDRLLVSDPKALQYIYQTSGYKFIKPPGRKELSRLAAETGIFFVEGDDHKRHRKVLLPGFRGPEAKFYVPVFFTHAGKSVVIDIPSWTSRATLDAIGEAAFDYQFGALNESAKPLTNAYTNMLFDTFAVATDNSTLSLCLMEWLPKWIVRFVVEKAPIKRLKHARMVRDLTDEVAKQLLNEKYEALAADKPKRDIMSLLGTFLVFSLFVDMNLTYAITLALIQLAAPFMFAVQETTATTLSWTFLELAKHREDLDTMPYLADVVKEVLRFHPIVYNNTRVAAQDHVLPLSKPVTLTTGKVVQEIAISKGSSIITSIASYNRNKGVWGEDAHIFDSTRWLRGDMNKQVPVGVYGTLFSFSGGIRSCIGWRFAYEASIMSLWLALTVKLSVLELHAFMAEVVDNFEFLLTQESEKIRREACAI
ncbi:cytochrome P450 [Armillaria fumosa]|nr:cytochrome P450 [Armillaria fumosa]